MKLLLRILPILAGLLACGIAGVIGIATIPADTYAKNPQASPGSTIGGIAFVAAMVVFLGVRYLVNNYQNKNTK